MRSCDRGRDAFVFRRPWATAVRRRSHAVVTCPTCTPTELDRNRRDITCTTNGGESSGGGRKKNTLRRSRERGGQKKKHRRGKNRGSVGGGRAREKTHRSGPRRGRQHRCARDIHGARGSRPSTLRVVSARARTRLVVPVTLRPPQPVCRSRLV